MSLEQGVAVCEFLGLNELEQEYYLKLISLERAGTEKLRKITRNELAKIKSQAQIISNRLNVSAVLPDEQKAIFYSDWYYSAIRLLVGIKGFDELESIANYVGLPRQVVGEIISFLLQSGLLIRENEKLKVGPSRTHLSADSPFIKLHHLNWRTKALEYIKYPDPEKLHYSAPMTIGASDVRVIREKILKLIEDVGKVVDPSPNEQLVCLNIDWFKIHPQKA